MTASTSNARHLLFRLAEPSRLPDSLLGVLRDEVVLAGWLRASGVLHDVQLRGLGGAPRSLAGPVQVVMLDGSIGMGQGDVSCGLRALLARETDTGLETIAGEIVAARVGALEVMVTALDDVNAARAPHPSGVSLIDAESAPGIAAPTHVAAPAPPPPAPSSENAVAEPELAAKPAAAKPSPTFSAFGGAAAMPQRPARPAVVEEEHIYPDAGDVVEHFAFGRCEVVKSDGDRLHLRLGKDGRVKEIALEMLKVTPLPPVEGQSGKHFRLDRRL